MTVHVTLVTGRADSGTGSMLVESLGKGILDSTCMKTVSGEQWMNENIENLNEEDKKEAPCSETENKSLFRFGDSLKSKSIKTVSSIYQVITFQCNSSGHYCVPLTILVRENCNNVFNSKNLLSLRNEEKKKKAIKLRRQLYIMHQKTG